MKTINFGSSYGSIKKIMKSSGHFFGVKLDTSSNSVTLINLLILPITLLFMFKEQWVLALVIYMFGSIYLDWLDGAVSRARDEAQIPRTQKDRIYGSCFDAIVDKIRQASVAMILLVETKSLSEHIFYTQPRLFLYSMYILVTFLLFCLILYESYIAFIRIRIYLLETKNPKRKRQMKILSSSTNQGKYKTALHVGGICFLILGLSLGIANYTWIPITIGTVALIISIVPGTQGLCEKNKQLNFLLYPQN